MYKYNDVLPSGRKVGNFYQTLKYDGFPKVRSIVTTLVPKYSVVFDDLADGLGYMNHNSRTLTLNPLYYLAIVDPLYDIIDKKYKNVPNVRPWEIWNRSLLWGLCGLVCHEIGHALYTLSPNEQAKYTTGLKIPDYFLHFCANVVEDSYIQNKMKDRFKWDLLRNGLDTSTAMFQGHTTCEEFSQKKTFTPKDKLFYFILRSYNPTFEPPVGCSIPEELIEDFLSFYYHSDNVERFKYTIKWAEKVYAWLEKELSSNNSSQSSSSQQDGDGDESEGAKSSGGQSQSVQDSGDKSGKSNGSQSVADAIKDLVESIQQATGVGSGGDKEVGEFNLSDFNEPTSSEKVCLCSGIANSFSNRVVPLSYEANKLLHAYNLNFQRLQCHSFNGVVYNLSSGKLNKKQLYKSDLTAKIFTRKLTRKREMDLYFGITLDASGSMSHLFDTLSDIVVPLIHSLTRVNAKSEMLVFSDDTVKVKDYYNDNVNNLRASVEDSNVGSGTNLLPSLVYFKNILKARPHKDKCVIVVTDGCTDNLADCVRTVGDLRKSGACVVGIGLRLGSDARWFRELFKEDSLIYSTEQSINQNIAPDLIKFLSNKFMR